MKVRPDERGKVAVLIVAILGVLFFALRPLIFRESPEPGPAVVSQTPTPAADPLGTVPIEPDIRVDQVDPTTGQVPPPINPFRQTVSLDPRRPSQGGASVEAANQAVSGGRPQPPPIDGELPTGVEPLPPVLPQALEFRLEGVLINRSSVAVVRRSGEIHHLRVGQLATHGYRITEIKPIGIRVTRKNESRWISVGDVFRPDESNDSIVG